MIMEAYYDAKAPGSYRGIDALYRLMKQIGENVTRKQVVDWLQSKGRMAYTSPSENVSRDENFILEELITCGTQISST